MSASGKTAVNTANGAMASSEQLRDVLAYVLAVKADSLKEARELIKEAMKHYDGADPALFLEQLPSSLAFRKNYGEKAYEATLARFKSCIKADKNDVSAMIELFNWGGDGYQAVLLHSLKSDLSTQKRTQLFEQYPGMREVMELYKGKKIGEVCALVKNLQSCFLANKDPIGQLLWESLREKIELLHKDHSGKPISQREFIGKEDEGIATNTFTTFTEQELVWITGLSNVLVQQQQFSDFLMTQESIAQKEKAFDNCQKVLQSQQDLLESQQQALEKLGQLSELQQEVFAEQNKVFEEKKQILMATELFLDQKQEFLDQKQKSFEQLPHQQPAELQKNLVELQKTLREQQELHKERVKVLDTLEQFATQKQEIVIARKKVSERHGQAPIFRSGMEQALDLIKKNIGDTQDNPIHIRYNQLASRKKSLIDEGRKLGVETQALNSNVSKLDAEANRTRSRIDTVLLGIAAMCTLGLVLIPVVVNNYLDAKKRAERKNEIDARKEQVVKRIGEIKGQIKVIDNEMQAITKEASKQNPYLARTDEELKETLSSVDKLKVSVTSNKPSDQSVPGRLPDSLAVVSEDDSPAVRSSEVKAASRFGLFKLLTPSIESLKNALGHGDEQISTEIITRLDHLEASGIQPPSAA